MPATGPESPACIPKRSRGREGTHLQWLDRGASLPSDHFHNLKMIRVQLGVCHALVLGVQLTGSKRAAVLCLKANAQDVLCGAVSGKGGKNTHTRARTCTHRSFCVRIGEFLIGCVCKYWARKRLRDTPSFGDTGIQCKHNSIPHLLKRWLRLGRSKLKTFTLYFPDTSHENPLFINFFKPILVQHSADRDELQSGFWG